MAEGLMVYPMGGTIDGQRGDHVLLAPPFIVDDAQLDMIVQRLARAVDAALATPLAATDPGASPGRSAAALALSLAAAVPSPLHPGARNEPNPQIHPAARRAGRIGPGAGPALDAGRRAAEVRHHRHRRRHRRVLRRRRRDLPPGQQGPRQTRHPLLGRIDRRLGVQRQHHQVGRARPGLRAIRRAVQRRQGPGRLQGCRRLDRRARGVLGAPRALHRAGAQGSQRQDLHRLQGQALQRRQPGLGHARVDGRAARGA